MNAPVLDRSAVDGPLISVSKLSKSFGVKIGKFGQGTAKVHALDDINLDIRSGETLSVVGESGSGKSTLGLNLLQLTKPTIGSVMFAGRDIVQNTPRENRAIRKHLQIIFQDPFSTLNPRMTVGRAIAQPMLHHGIATKKDVREQVLQILSDVGLSRRFENSYPHEMSGGQCQRVVIGRALACRPKFIVCDEATSALDVSVQAQIINLLMDLQEKYGLTYLFIAHDLSVVRHISDRVIVLYLGKIAEIAAPEEIFTNPKHPYTKALLSSVPVFGKKKTAKTELQGEMPSPLAPPAGCRFHTRCPIALEKCRREVPQLRLMGSATVACHRAEEATAT